MLNSSSMTKIYGSYILIYADAMLTGPFLVGLFEYNKIWHMLEPCMNA